MAQILIMTPGPTYVSEEVRRAMARPITNPDIDPDFYEFYMATTKKVAKLLKTQNQVVILNGEGILGLEAACASLIEPGDRVLCIDNGIFGRGFGDFVKIYGGEVVYFKGDYRKPVDVVELESFIKENGSFKMATIVHCETPSGLLNPVDEICPMLKRYNILTVVDAVSSIGGEDIRVDEWKIDMVLGASQKCISASPGLAFMSISEDAWNAILNRKVPIASYYCNLSLWKTWYSDKWFPYTQPVSDLYGFECAVDNTLSDNEKYKRHSRIGGAVRKTLVKSGFELYPMQGYSNTVTAFMRPEGLDEKAFLNRLVDKHQIMISGAFDVLAGKVLRIGHMGENCYEDKIRKMFKGIDNVLREFDIIPQFKLHKIFDEFIEKK